MKAEMVPAITRFSGDETDARFRHGPDLHWTLHDNFF
jgi:hypothetical protein